MKDKTIDTSTLGSRNNLQGDLTHARSNFKAEDIPGSENQHGFNPNGDSQSSNPEYDIETELKKYQELFRQTSQWLAGIIELARLETSKNFKAYAKSLAFTLALLPLGIIFYVSFIGSISYLSYFFSENVFVGIATLLVSQIAVLWYCFAKSTEFKEKIGYQQTKHHVKEAKDELVAIFGG